PSDAGRDLLLVRLPPDLPGRRGRPGTRILGRPRHLDPRHLDLGHVTGLSPRYVSNISEARRAWQAGHRPQNVTSASSSSSPCACEGSRQGASPTAQSTSAISPQPRHTTWWWLVPARRPDPAGL